MEQIQVPQLPEFRSFRFVFDLKGLSPHTITSVKSMPGKMIIIEKHWIDADEQEHPESTVATLKLHDKNGNVLRHYLIRFGSCEDLLFDLDYSKDSNLKQRIVLREVAITEMRP